MRKILTCLLAFACLLPSYAQKDISIWTIRTQWKDLEYDMDLEGSVAVCAMSFADHFYDYPLLHALSAQFTNDFDNIDIPVADFKFDEENNYVMIRLASEQLAEAEGRVWTLPGGKSVFVFKLVNHEETNSYDIYFFDLDLKEGRMIPMRNPEGLRYGFIDNFIIPREGCEIEVRFENQPSDKIVLQDDGAFVYKEFAPNAISAYISDPDPSGMTNIRETPGGKIIGRIGDPANHQASDDDDYYDDDDDDFGGSFVLTLFNPVNGWWEILERNVDGIKIKDHAWIHYSVLQDHTRNYDGQPLNLYEKPDSSSKVVGVIKKAMTDVRPMDISEDGEWVKVTCEWGTGWLEARWLCSNTFTYCS
ncbi:MAG: hypothetical protein J5520_07170 [Bacteroidales bacterium]|nr:hypothetical protein [Bacteroidales bacterium]